MDYKLNPAKRHRVIVNTDAKNEADDQFAIVHAILTQSFDLRGIIAAHFGRQPGRSDQPMQESYDEILLLLKLMNLTGKIRVEKGANDRMADEKTPARSPGADFIIEEAMKDDPRKLNVLFYGPLTEMATALLIEPGIEDRVHCIWIGGSDRQPHYGMEFNLRNDIHSANVVMKSKMQVTQVPYEVYTNCNVSYAELEEKCYPHGELGKYLLQQLIDYNATKTGMMEYRSLGDSPAVGVLLAPMAGKWSWQPAPEYDLVTCDKRVNGKNRPIRVYESFDCRFLFEDMFAKIAKFARDAKKV